MESFLVLGATFGLTEVALGAFGSHALGAKLPPERSATFETGSGTRCGTRSRCS
jgi:uncharacterized membrane protein YgdD (TMEM256/DUF423 family)